MGNLTWLLLTVQPKPVGFVHCVRIKAWDVCAIHECACGFKGKRLWGPVREVSSGSGFCCKMNSSCLQTMFCLILVLSHKTDRREWVALSTNSVLRCRSYTCAVGVGVVNDAKQNKVEGDFYGMLVATLIMNNHFKSANLPYTIE